MARRVGLSGEQQAPDIIVAQRSDVRAGLILHHSLLNPDHQRRFRTYTAVDIDRELALRLEEVDRQAMLNLLAAIEAAFYLDYLQRCYRRTRDPLSRAMRALYKGKGGRVSLDRDLLEIWKTNTFGADRLIAEIRSAMNLRHWLAHGRWWEPKLGRAYDFFSIELLAAEIFNSFPFVS